MKNPHLPALTNYRSFLQAAFAIIAAFLLFALAMLDLGNAPPVHAIAFGTYYVDAATGSDTTTCGDISAPCQTISHTVNTRAASNDVIIIAGGTYTENLVFSGIILTLKGGYTTGSTWLPGGETVIDGGGVDRTIFIHDNSYVTLEGLTIANGKAPEAACWGGGINVTNGTAILRNVIVRDNQAVCTGGGSGAGLNANADEGPAAIFAENIEVVGNNATEHGSALATWQVTIVFTNAMIFGNGHSPLAIDQSDFTMVNSTVADNDAGGNVLLDFGNVSTVTIRNSIMVNSGGIQCGGGGSVCDITYSDIQGGWSDTGNIDANPQFVDPANGDFHLQAWSPAIDAGTSTDAPATDFEGDSRPQNSGVDMGADEFVGTPVSNTGNRYVDVGGSDAGPNLCLDSNSPCQSIGQAIGFANQSETIFIAQGTYTENLYVNSPLIIEGGYESSGWTRDLALYETIIDGAGSPTNLGDWDGKVRKPAVINDGGTYKMWFDGKNLMGETAVGYATSPNGITWTKYISNPVLLPVPMSWESNPGEFAPYVLNDGGTYKMWYESSGNGPRQLGYATSSDGINWTRYGGNPILSPGPGGYDQEGVGHGTVLNESGTYKLWYHALGDQGAIIAYATSSDGINWTKQGAVLLPDGANWDTDAVWGPSVLNLNGTYWMWYGAVGAGTPPSIGVATSADGINWTRPLTMPTLSSGAPIGDPMVITDSGKLKMWYNNFEDGRIKYAESTDGLNWSPVPGSVALTPGAGGQWGGAVVTIDPGGSGTVLDGLTLTGGKDAMGGGVHATCGQDVAIFNSLITGNFASGAPDSQGAGGVLGGLCGSSVQIENSRIISNTVGQGAGGVRVHDGNVDIINTLIANNQGDAGLHVNGALSIMNVTIAGNDGNVVFNPPPGVVMTGTNSIVYDGGGVWTEQGVLNITYSDIEGGITGTGNIDLPPQFVDPAGNDFHLLGTSPAIDTGTPAGATPIDLDGTPRDTQPDMGAYEHQRFTHDIHVTDVQPAGDIAVGVAIPIRATLYNVGSQAESSVPATCTITTGSSTVYSQTLSSGSIPQLSWVVMTFPDFTPSAAGSYDITCTANLATDGNAANNSFTRTITAKAEIADVWTRDNPDDNGDEPSDLNNWYESPDLWVRNANDGGLIHQDPVANQTNYVYVRLRNRGTIAITGTVDVYWIEPSLGVRCGDWAYIDTVAFSELLPGETRIVNVPWTPSRTGHTCLQDVVDSAADPYNRSLECSPLWVPWDNNVEWHNVNILSNTAAPRYAGVMDIKTADVQLVNVYNLPKDVDLIVDRRTFPTTGTITVQLPSAVFDRWQASGNAYAQDITVFTTTKKIEITGAVSGTIGAIPMDPAEAAQVGFEFTGPAGLTFELSVRERIDGTTVGGLTYQWTIPDTTPPDVNTVSPAAAATAAADAPIVVAFNEPVSPLNFSLALTPDPGGWQYVWNVDSTVVTATHTAFTASTTFTATVTASDAANNAMTAPVSWAFTSANNLIYLPLVLK